MSVNRYDPADRMDGRLDQEDGAFVTFHDYENLDTRLAALKEENEVQLLRHEIERNQLKARVEELDHAANEWRHACVMAFQHIKDIRDDHTLTSSAITDMDDRFRHCNKIWTAALKEPANEG